MSADDISLEERRQRRKAAIHFGWTAAEQLRTAVDMNLAMQQRREDFTTAELICTLSALLCQDAIIGEFCGAVGEPPSTEDMIRRLTDMTGMAFKVYMPQCREIMIERAIAGAQHAAEQGGLN